LRVEDFIIDGLRNGGNNQQSGALGADCCPTNNNQVLGANIGGLGADCCPVNNNNQVLGESTGRRIEVPEVLGINEGSTLIELCIPILPPGFSILFNSIERNIVFDALVAGNKKVFINGRLIRKIPFETCDRSVVPNGGNITRIVLSNVRAVTVEAVFALCIDIPEARRGDRVVVLRSSVESVELPNLLCPNQPCIRSVTEKDCISVKVKVERDTIITVPTTAL